MIEKALSEGKGMVITQPYCNSSRASAQFAWQTPGYYIWEGDFGEWPAARNPYK